MVPSSLLHQSLRTYEQRLRFGNSTFSEAKRTLSRTIPGAKQFLFGRVYLQDKTGRPTPVRIVPTQRGDAQQILNWYAAKPAGEPTYFANQKWRFWWQQKIEARNSKFNVFKLVTDDNRILGVVALIKNLLDKADNRTTTWLEGIRIAPLCNSMMTATPDFKGVGAALVTHAAIQSLKNGDEGLGLNSTLGAEGFYEKLGLQSRPAIDGIRTCFYVKGREEVLDFLRRQFEKYNALAEKMGKL